MTDKNWTKSFDALLKQISEPSPENFQELLRVTPDPDDFLEQDPPIATYQESQKLWNACEDHQRLIAECHAAKAQAKQAA